MDGDITYILGKTAAKIDPILRDAQTLSCNRECVTENTPPLVGGVGGGGELVACEAVTPGLPLVPKLQFRNALPGSFSFHDFFLNIRNPNGRQMLLRPQ